MAKRFLVFLLSFIMMTGCKVGNSVVLISTVTPFSTALSTGTPTHAPTVTQTSSPTVSPDVMRYQCLDVLDNLPLGKTPDGVLVFKNEDNTDAFLWDMKADTQIRFPREEGERILSFSVSPNAQYVVYHQVSLDVIDGKYSSSNDRTVMTKADGVPIWSQPNSGYSWFDHERLFALIRPTTGYPYITFGAS